jgi:hypothetical protein
MSGGNDGQPIGDFKICARLISQFVTQKITCLLQVLLNKLEILIQLILVPVPHYYGTVVPSGTVSLVPSIL